MTRHRPATWLLTAALLAAAPAHAGTIVSLDTGRARIGDYDSTAFNRLSVGYGTGPLSVTVSAYDFADFSRPGEPRLDLNARSAEAFWTQDLGPLRVKLGGGLFDWDSETTFNGQTLGRDSGTSTMAEVGVSQQFGRNTGVYLNYRWMDDLAGEALTTVSGGVQLGF